jgi:LacI family transcriptional regulator
VPVTIRDVALKAGVGLSTVSRVVRDSPKVDPETRARVEEAIAELGYVPIRSGRHLRTGKTMSIGVIVPFMTLPPFVETLHGAASRLSSAGYDLVVFNLETAERRPSLIAEVVRSRRVDGLILIALTPSDDEVETIRQAGLPTVLVGARHPLLPRIIVDDVRAGHLVTDYLLGLGHRRIGFLGDRPAPGFQFVETRDRHLGYVQALRAAKIEPEAEWFAAGEGSRSFGRGAARQMLSLGEHTPTAIFCFSDLLALGVLEAARDLGVEVPRELSIVGFDDTEMAEHVELTSVRHGLFDAGGLAVDLLLAAIELGEMGADEIEQPAQLIVRRTTAAPS